MVVVYLGLITAFLGAVSLVKPLRFLLIRTRWQAAAVLAAGCAVILIGGWLPAGETRVTTPRSQLDRFAPVYQFSEFHSAWGGGAERTGVSRAQIGHRGGRCLVPHTDLATAPGALGRREHDEPPAGQPLLDLAARTSFIVLAEEPDREIVLGTLVAVPRGWRPSTEPSPENFKALHDPGFALAAMNFRLEDDKASAGRASSSTKATIVTTETRVYATDSATVRRFARYWRVIYPGSPLLRRMWLRAVVRRAESGPA